MKENNWESKSAIVLLTIALILLFVLGLRIISSIRQEYKAKLESFNKKCIDAYYSGYFDGQVDYNNRIIRIQIDTTGNITWNPDFLTDEFANSIGTTILEYD